MTLADLEARCRARLTRVRTGHAVDPTHSRSLAIPATRATAMRLDALALVMTERMGDTVSGRQIAGVLLADALAAIETTVPADG